MPGRTNSIRSGGAPFTRRSFLTGSSAVFGLTALGALTSCGSDGGGGGGGKAPVSWSVWGNPGEVKRLQEFTDDFNERNPGIEAKLIPVPTDQYETKLLTQLSGNTAPDVFYAGDTLLARLVKNNSILPLKERLESEQSESPPEDFFEGLWGNAKDPSGEIYGVTVDCNPVVLWFNTKVLADAGVTTLPTERFEAGEWTREAFEEIAGKVKASGRRVGALGSDWMSVYSWMTANGGKVYENGRFVAHEDPKSVDAFVWLRRMLDQGAFVYAGSLPEGQGQEALFMSNNIAFAMGVGRWVLPLFKQNSALEYDIVPYPSHDGALPVTPVATASMVINTKARDPDAAFTFLTQFVSREGQEFRLADAGNAVPSIKGPDQVVLEGGIPEHARIWLDLREKGYAPPIEESRTPGLRQEISKRIDVVWTRGGDARAALAEIGAVANRMIEKAANG